MSMSKQDREDLKIFISKSSINSRKMQNFEIFEHRRWKALQNILHLFSNEDQYKLKMAFSHKDEVIIGNNHPNFYSIVSEIYKNNGIDPKQL